MNYHSVFQQIIIIFLMLLILVGAPGCESSSDLALESPLWYLKNKPAPSSATVETIIDSIIPNYNHKLTTGLKNRPHGIWRIDTVGTLNDRIVLDLLFEVKNANPRDSSIIYTRIEIKAIVVQTIGDNYRIVYLSWLGFDDAPLELSQVIIARGTEVLHTKSQMFGTGCFMDEGDWVWDKKAQVVRELGVNIPMSVRIIPSGHGIWKGGGFDLDSLKYSSWTWRDGDGNCCPSGGKYTVEYEINYGQLLVKRAIFNYSELEERALWSAQRSEDSIYLKQPSIIYEPEINYTYNPISAWRYYSKNRYQFVTSPQATPLEILIENHIKREISWGESEFSKTVISNYQVDTIGIVGSKLLVEIDFSFNNPQFHYKHGKSLAIETDPSLFRLLSLDMDANIISGIGQDAIFSIGNKTIITMPAVYPLKHPIFWLWSDKYNCPVRLYPFWAINETINLHVPKYIPEYLSIRSDLGIFTLEKLLFETFTWRENDPDNIPSGGFLKIKFGIENEQIQPLEIEFDPDSTMH